MYTYTEPKKKRNLENKENPANTTLTTHNTLPAHVKNYPLATPHPTLARSQSVSSQSRQIDKKTHNQRKSQENFYPV